MIINRCWAMPNKWTFQIEPIRKLIKKYITSNFIDPFCGQSIFKNYCLTNDINSNIEAEKNMCALDFLEGQPSKNFSGGLFDPPYSPRQIKECYQKLGVEFTKNETNSAFRSNLKKELARVIIPGGIAISFGWNSNGLGKSNGFEIVEILIVAHGASHNDTIVTVERKSKLEQLNVFDRRL